MKKKKRKLNRYDWGNLIVGLAIIVFMIVGLYIYSQEPQFIITKQECWNETEIIGEKLVGEPYTITYPYRVRTYDSDGYFDDICIHKGYIEAVYPSCGNSSYCHYNNWDSCDWGRGSYPFCYGVEHKIYRENCSETHQKMEDIYDTRIICEQVPVDEIEFSYAGCDCSNLIRDNKKTADMLCKKCGIGEGVWNGTDYVYIWLEKGEYTLKWVNKSLRVIVPKSKIQIEWLDENAHFEDCSVGTTNEVGIKCISKCSKYKIGNYTIETWSQIK